MDSIKDLIERHGIGIKIVSTSKMFSKFPFTVLSVGGKYARVKYKDGEIGMVEIDVPSCNDYVLV